MTAEQIISLYQFDHGILHAIEPIDEPWNLTPRLIAPHREKSRKDTAIVAKVKRLDKMVAWSRIVIGKPKRKRPPSKYKWPKRKFKSSKAWRRDRVQQR